MCNDEWMGDERLQLVNDVIMMDTLTTVKVLIERVNELEEQILQKPTPCEDRDFIMN